MTPGSFDADTCREMVGDDRARKLEAKAREDADRETYDPPLPEEGSSYWSQCSSQFELIVYTTQFNKRMERNKRKREGTPQGNNYNDKSKHNKKAKEDTGRDL